MEAVVDANVIIHGRGSYPFDKAITVQEVVEELESQRSRDLLRNTDCTVKHPSEVVLEKVEKRSQKLNSPTSEADEKLLALAIDEGKELITDDFALQNLSLHMGHSFSGFLEDEPDQKYEWKTICRNCGAEKKSEKCSNCGSTSQRLKQVPYS